MQRIKGISNTRVYNIWAGMKQRCYNPNNQHYARYGGRGITMCKEWLGEDGASVFYEWALSHGYSDGLSIDRVDNEKGYSPENCIWIPPEHNASLHNMAAKIVYVMANVPTFETRRIRTLIKTIPDRQMRDTLNNLLANRK